MSKRPASPKIPPQFGTTTRRGANAYVVCGIGASLVLAVALVFGQTLAHTLLVFDDAGLVSDNPLVRAGLTGEGFRWAFLEGPFAAWVPLAMLSHMLDCQLFGLNAWGHHLTNVLLHAAATVAMFLVCRQMTGQRAVPDVAQASGVPASGARSGTSERREGRASGPERNNRVAPADPSAATLWPSALVAALFAVHPQHVESVAWIAERRDVLSGLLFALTLAAYLGYVHHGRTPARYALLAVLLTLSLLAKPMLVTLPALLLLLDYWPLGRIGQTAITPDSALGENGTIESTSLRWLVVEKLPLFALAVGACLMTVRHGSAGRPHFDWSLRIGGALTSTVAYLGDFFCPVDLYAFYPYPLGGFPLWQGIAAAALLTLISSVAVIERRRFPELFVGWFWYLGMLVPVMGLVTISNHARADRYTYLPAIGLSIALVLPIARLVAGVPWRRRIAVPCATVAIAVLAVLSFRQAAVWRDDETLWRHALACDPENAKAEFALADALARQGRIDEAIVYFRRAETHPIDAAPFSNLGVILAARGELNEAIQQYRQALAIEPNYYAAHVNLGVVLLRQNELAQAETHFRRGVAINPSGVEARCGLARVLVAVDQLEAARAELDAAVAANPHSALAQSELAGVLLRQGEYAQARRHCQAALKIDPRFLPALVQLARAHSALGETDQAAANYRRVLELDPHHLLARRGLDELLSSQR